MALSYFQSNTNPKLLDRQVSDDPFAVHDFDIKIDMDLPISSKYSFCFPKDTFHAHPIRISDILSWDIKSYLTQADT